MQINGKDININDLLTEVDADIDKNIPKKRNNNLVLRDSQIEILKKYNSDYEKHTNLNSLIFEIEEILNYETDLEDLENLSEELQEKLDECESPTFGMSISQISCYEVFIDILKRLPKPAHEIEEKLIKIFLNDK